MHGKIRLASEDDAKCLAAIYAPYVQDTAISFEYSVPTKDDFKIRIRDGLKVAPWLVYISQNKIVGYAYACKHRVREAYQWSVDVSVYVSANHQRQGIGKALYTELFQILKDMGYRNAFAGIALPNANSVGLHEAMGFEKIGIYKSVGYKLNKWHDVGWWQKVLNDSPQSPKVISEFHCTRAVQKTKEQGDEKK